VTLGKASTIEIVQPPPKERGLLEVEDLAVSVTTDRGGANAVDGISLQVRHGEAVGLVGESGSGKSLTLRAILRLLPAGASISGGRVWFEGVDLLGVDSATMRSVRGQGIAMVLQDPLTGLNPVMRVGEQIVDAARHRQGWSRAEAREQAIRMARRMGIQDAESCLALYPHELSGGLRQRVMIAAALACQPRLILCDEPTTALDVTIQDQIVRLLARLRGEMNMSLLYVTHDLAVVAQFCQRVEVMYSGHIVEAGPVSEVFRTPLHPYTQGLLRATPDIDASKKRLQGIPGFAPSPLSRPSGCAFRTRCEFADKECETGSFPLRVVGSNRSSACIHFDRMRPSRETPKISE
jgi:oligopeptide/dipeptide ABC transporter ATP-binding protein